VSELSEANFRDLADLLGWLYEPCALDAFPARALAALPAVVGLDTCSYNESNPSRRRVLARMEPAGCGFPGMAEVFEEHVGQHPMVRHYRDTRDDRACKITDFLSLREFRRLPIYREYFRVIGVDRQLAVTVPGRLGFRTGLAVSRAGRDFSERDRAALDFLRPHLARAYAGAAAMTAHGLDAGAQIERAGQECDGAAVITADGRLSHISDRGGELLSQYFAPATPAGYLPRMLRRWLAAVMARTQPAGPAPAVLASRQVGSGGSRLGLTLISADADGSVILALAVQAADPAARAAGLGLTRRETEVLTLAAEGRTNREIATSLRISPLTVRTHLEHAYSKLGVGNRTAAAARLR
jgi:DNA-binding CsgD family transcriptional regulator